MRCDIIFGLGGQRHPPEDSHHRLGVTGPSTSYGRQTAELTMLTGGFHDTWRRQSFILGGLTQEMTLIETE